MTTWYTPGYVSGSFSSLYQSTTDGSSWSLVPSSTVIPAVTTTIHDFRQFSDGSFLLFAGNNVYTSPGTTGPWTAVQTGLDNSGLYAFIDAYFGDDKQVIIGVNNNTGHIVSWVSSNRFTAVTGPNDIGLIAVSGFGRTNNGSHFIIVYATLGAVTSQFYSSDDGITWTARGITSPQAGVDDTAQPGLFHGTGPSVQVGRNFGSPFAGVWQDGVDGLGAGWTEVLTATPSTIIHQNAVASRTVPENMTESAGCLYFEDGTPTAHTFISANGLTWSYNSSVTGPFGGAGVVLAEMGRLADTGTFIFVYNKIMYRSTDGITFSAVSGLTGVISGLTTPSGVINTLNSTPANFLQPDRNIPLAIAGPRADQVLAQYQPFARVFTH